MPADTTYITGVIRSVEGGTLYDADGSTRGYPPSITYTVAINSPDGGTYIVDGLVPANGRHPDDVRIIAQRVGTFVDGAIINRVLQLKFNETIDYFVCAVGGG